MLHQITKPTFNYSDLEPYIDSLTMELHTEKHHQGYADKLNAALSNRPDLQNKSLEELVALGTKDQGPITNFAGGVVNHDFFWTILSPEFDQPVPEVFKPLIPQFTDAATKLFGSGWTWLVKENDELKIINLPNQDSPIALHLTPLLSLDLWEHAYYLKYQNRRAEYIEAFWHIVNWKHIHELLK